MDSTHSLARHYATSHPDAAADCLATLEPDRIAPFLDGLEPDLAAPVLKELWPGFFARVLDHLDAGRAARLMESLDFARLMVLLSQLPAASREGIISAFPLPLAQRVRHALSLPEGTVGGVADSTLMPFDGEATVTAVRAGGLDSRLPYLYVVDEDYRLAGVVHRRELDDAPGSVTLRSIMTTRVQSLISSDPILAVFDHAAWSSLDALPVVDDRGAFFGVIRHKALRAKLPERVVAPGPAAAMTTLLDLGEVYWSSLFSAIEALSSVDPD